jgi:hypothetical protein
MATNLIAGGQPIYLNFATVNLAITLTITSNQPSGGNAFDAAVFPAGTAIPVGGVFAGINPSPSQLVTIYPQQSCSITFDVPSDGGFITCDKTADGTWQMEVAPWGNEPG